MHTPVTNFRESLMHKKSVRTICPGIVRTRHKERTLYYEIKKDNCTNNQHPHKNHPLNHWKKRPDISTETDND